MERKTPAARFDPCRDPYTTALIRKKVTALTSKRPFTRADRDDLYQEILSAVAASAENIDDEIGHRNPYITAIVERQVSSIRKRQQASKRNNAGVSSLNVSAESDDGRTTDLISTSMHLAATSESSRFIRNTSAISSTRPTRVSVLKLRVKQRVQLLW